MSFLLRRAMMASGVIASSYDPYFEQVVLLLHMDGSNGGTTFTDSSNLAQSITPTSATTSTTQVKFGTTSAFLSTGSSRLLTTTMPVLGTADFTVEGWFYQNSVAAPQVLVMTPNFTSSTGWELYTDTARLVVQVSSASLMISTGTVAANAWNHIVWQRKAGIAYFYINGVLDATTATYTNNITDTALYVGYTAAAMVGYTDDVRVTKNLARYTTTFTPPTAAFPNSSGNVYATWNPSDKAGTITLSNGNRTATSTASGNQSIRSTVSKSANKWYWEVKVDSVGGAGTVIGISNSTESLTNYPGQTANSLGYHSNGNYYYNGAVVVIGATYAAGDVIGVALGITGGTITFYKNGVSQGSWSYAVTGSLFAIADSYAAGTATTANFGATPFKYTIPAGYNPGLF